ncbi:DsbA family protein [Oceanobacillus sp. J11TS1]|uniref:DsbA family protein n=1 Tax=Oceanobacillus sp. J11TS1 TaxID=2807191 RepID=UPI001B1D375A|nr:DsbA family protein [Oceanobacillus sp. J11TS1]GIO22826.1 disulfide bond formation protein D [Oceanobacillus sp. J11TS1]
MKGSPIKIVVIITLAIVALIVALIVLNNNNSEYGEEQSFERQPSIDGQPTIGDSDAPVTVVEFGDFKCPACKAWGETVYPQLVSDYVDTGKIQFAFINVLFHGEESKLGSLAAESVYKQNSDAYWDFHNALFAEQPSDDHHSVWITTDKTLEVAGGIPNIDVEQLKVDVESNTAIEEVNKDTELVTEFEVQLTPTIMVNNTVIEDPFDYESIKQAIDNALKGN